MLRNKPCAGLRMRRCRRATVYSSAPRETAPSWNWPTRTCTRSALSPVFGFLAEQLHIVFSHICVLPFEYPPSVFHPNTRQCLLAFCTSYSPLWGDCHACFQRSVTPNSLEEFPCHSKYRENRLNLDAGHAGAGAGPADGEGPHQHARAGRGGPPLGAPAQPRRGAPLHLALPPFHQNKDYCALGKPNMLK